MGMTSQVVFRVASEKYGVDIYQAGAIEKGVPATYVAGMPTFIKGFFELRGKQVPIVNLRERFNKPKLPEGELFDFIVSNTTGREIAYVVDGVDTILNADVNEDERANVFFGANLDYVKKIINYEGVIVLIDIDKILTPQEHAELETFMKLKDEEKEDEPN